MNRNNKIIFFHLSQLLISPILVACLLQFSLIRMEKKPLSFERSLLDNLGLGSTALICTKCSNVKSHPFLNKKYYYIFIVLCAHAHAHMCEHTFSALRQEDNLCELVLSFHYGTEIRPPGLVASTLPTESSLQPQASVLTIIRKKVNTL